MKRTAKVELVFPHWLGTCFGLLIIAAMGIGAMAVVQARIIDQQAAYIMELANTVDALSARVEEFNKDRAALRELQDWRIGVTIASRSGWGAANRYIQDNPLPMPDEKVAKEYE